MLRCLFFNVYFQKIKLVEKLVAALQTNSKKCGKYLVLNLLNKFKILFHKNNIIFYKNWTWYCSINKFRFEKCVVVVINNVVMEVNHDAQGLTQN